MKKVVAIFFLLLLCLQAIPVLHFFSSQKSVFYSYVDEDKPAEAKMKEKSDGKEYLLQGIIFPECQPALVQHHPFYLLVFPSPYLEAFTPPPNPAC